MKKFRFLILFLLLFFVSTLTSCASDLEGTILNGGMTDGDDVLYEPLAPGGEKGDYEMSDDLAIPSEPSGGDTGDDTEGKNQGPAAGQITASAWNDMRNYDYWLSLFSQDDENQTNSLNEYFIKLNEFTTLINKLIESLETKTMADFFDDVILIFFLISGSDIIQLTVFDYFLGTQKALRAGIVTVVVGSQQHIKACIPGTVHNGIGAVEVGIAGILIAVGGACQGGFQIGDHIVIASVVFGNIGEHIREIIAIYRTGMVSYGIFGGAVCQFTKLIDIPIEFHYSNGRVCIFHNL